MSPEHKTRVRSLCAFRREIETHFNVTDSVTIAQWTRLKQNIYLDDHSLQTVYLRFLEMTVKNIEVHDPKITWDVDMLRAMYALMKRENIIDISTLMRRAAEFGDEAP